MVCGIILSNRREIQNMNYREVNIIFDGCQKYIDNHADNHFFGRNFFPIAFTSHDEQINFLNKWIMHHKQVVRSPIVNDFLNVKIDGQTEPQLVTKLLLQVSLREIHNKLV